MIASLDEAARAIVVNAETRATSAGVRAATSVVDGRTAEAIVERAKAERVDAIVIGTKAKRGLERMLSGSTADGVLRRANVPVFVVPPDGGEPASALARLLVAIDESDPSEAATAFAISFAAAGRSRLIFCGVAHGARAPKLEEARESIQTLLSNATERARECDVRCEWVIVDGAPESMLPSIARSERAGAIVMGTHGRHGPQRWLVGSVAEGVVQGSSLPVVVVRGAPNGGEMST
jgi:nucleotide-binding universal stress UspA family protein